MAADRPLMAADRPLMAADHPLRAADRPLRAAERPLRAAERPLKAADRPLKALNARTAPPAAQLPDVPVSRWRDASNENASKSALRAARSALYRTWRGAYHDRQPNSAPGGMSRRGLSWMSRQGAKHGSGLHPRSGRRV